MELSETETNMMTTIGRMCAEEQIKRGLVMDSTISLEQMGTIVKILSHPLMLQQIMGATKAGDELTAGLRTVISATFDSVLGGE